MAIKYHLPLNGNLDEVISGHPITSVGNVRFVDGPGLQVLEQTSNDPCGVTLEDPDINILNFCVAFWVRPTAMPDTEFDMVMSGVDQQGERIIHVDTRYPDNAFLLAAFKSNSERVWTTHNLSTTSELNQFRWMHIAIGVSEGHAYFYRDGELVGRKEMNHLYNENTPLKELRLVEVNATNDFNGASEVRGGDFEVSDFRVYDSMLSQQQVFTLYKRPIFHFPLIDEQSVNSGTFVYSENQGSVFNHLLKGHDFTNGGIVTDWNPRYLPGQIHFTMSAEVKLESAGDGRILEVRDANKPGAPLITFRQESGTIYALLRDDAGGRKELTHSMEVDGKWHTVTIVVLDGRASIYIDGEFIKSHPDKLAGTIDLRGQYFVVGARNIDGTIDYPYQSVLRNVFWFDTALTKSEIRKLIINGNGNDGEGGFMVKKGLWEQPVYDPLVDGYNLLMAGDEEYGYRHANSSFQYIPREDGNHEYIVDIQHAAIWFDQAIEVYGNGLDTFDNYGIYSEVKALDVVSQTYFMIVCYDKNMRRIAIQDVNIQSGTTTTVTQQVNPGDQWVYVDNVAGWTTGSTRPSTYHNMVYWLDDPSPYDVYKYARRRENYTSTDVNNNRVYFENGWPGPTLPAGTPVANSFSGGTFSYIGASGRNLNPTEGWVGLEGQTGNSDSVGGLRYGTKFIKVGWLLNRYTSEHSRSALRRIRCWNKDSHQRIDFLKGKFFADREGRTNIYELNEGGSVGNPKHWFPFTGNVDDLGQSSSVEATDIYYDYESIYLNGQSSHVTIEDHVPLDEEFTVFTWYKMSSNDRYTHLLSNDDQHQFAFKIGITDPYNADAYIHSSKIGSKRFGIKVPTDEWVSLATTYKNGELRQYYNGKLVKTHFVNFNPIPGGRYQVGRSGQSSSEWSHGNQKDLLVYTERLESIDIARLHSSTGPNRKDKISHVQDRLLISGELYSTV